CGDRGYSRHRPRPRPRQPLGFPPETCEGGWNMKVRSPENDSFARDPADCADAEGAAVRRRLRLYFVAGSADCDGAPERVLDAAIRGGITAFQFRNKGEGALRGE